MRIVFFGTPEFAVPTLDAVASRHEVVLAVAQPDKPAGRGMRVNATPVAARARELGITVAQPAKIRTAEFLEVVRACAADAAVVIAYGRILSPELLALPRLGFFNVHASLLPRYRGAAPIQRAIEAGDTETGVTIMRVDAELDHGPMLARVTVPIGPDEHTPALAARLAAAGGEVMLRVLDEIERGVAVETPQDHAAATYAPKIEKHEGVVDWSAPTKTIYDRFRAFDPWPGLSTAAGTKLTDIRTATGTGSPGTILEIGRDVVVAAGDGALRIVTMQRPGKPRAAAGDVARGMGWRVGASIA